VPVHQGEPRFSTRSPETAGTTDGHHKASNDVALDGWNIGPPDWLFFDLNKIEKFTNALDRE
jgi:hypothetical protein